VRTAGVLLASFVALVAWSGEASADPWKDESGHGKWRGSYERNVDDWLDTDARNYRRERRRRGDFRAEYRPRAFCKVERKRDGDE
jgi:hypothetical protein